MTTDVQTAWDDLETLVFDRQDVQAALLAARSVLDEDHRAHGGRIGVPYAEAL